MSETVGRLNQLETLLNAQRSLEAAIDRINAQLRLRPPNPIRLKLLAAKAELVVRLDEVRRKINDILSRRSAINPPSTETIEEMAELADQTEKETNPSATADAALNLANNVMTTSEKLDLE
jgi:hypothetical protein